MQSLWHFTGWLPYQVSLTQLVKHCEFINSREVYEAFPPTGEFTNQFPTPLLKLTLESFDVDCFVWDSLTLVSERMRDALALGPTEIQYFDVDSEKCAPKPKSLKYKVMHVPVTEDVSEKDRSQFSVVRLTPDSSPIPADVRAIALRAGADTKRQIFRDKYFRGHCLCTDDLAVRVLGAGCTGVRFIDLGNLNAPHHLFRTLRGVEREVNYDPFRKRLNTELVRAPH